MSDTKCSAVMVTGKDTHHEALAKVAIQCFKNQSWSDRELVIINDGSYSLGSDPEHNIFEMRVSSRNPRLTLGELRNMGMHRATGDWVLQWDDDDWHHPERMAYQMNRRIPGKAQTLVHQVRFSATTQSCFRYGCGQGIAGTILHPASPDMQRQYPAKPSGEDSDFWLSFPREERHTLDNALHAWLYIRQFHGSNTWNEKHIMKHLHGAAGRILLTTTERDVLKQAKRDWGYPV